MAELAAECAAYQGELERQQAVAGQLAARVSEAEGAAGAAAAQAARAMQTLKEYLKQSSGVRGVRVVTCWVRSAVTCCLFVFVLL